MATIQKISGATGISYKITVSSGLDRMTGKQVRHYMTYTPPTGMKENRADKEAARAAMEFEEKLKQGYQVDNRLTFAEYAQYALETKQRAGLKKTTYDRYVSLLSRINPAIGHMKLQDIRPMHLNQFYANLMERGIRNAPEVAKPMVDLAALMKEKKISQQALARRTGLGTATIRNVIDGKTILAEKAARIAQVFDRPCEDMFQCSKNRTPLSNKTCLEYHRLIRTILGLAEKELLVPYNAASKATPPKVQRPEVNTFQPEQITAILQALEQEPIRWRTLVHLLIITGCRRGEIMGLRWEQVDLYRGVLHVCETLLATDHGAHVDTPKTRESRRYINVPGETIELLKEYKKEQDSWKVAVGDLWEPTGYVFTNHTGQAMHPDSINKWLVKFSQRHGLPHINPHAFRHSMASILINSGTDILAISRRLGHATTSTTLNFYAHVLQQADARSSECIADVLLRGNRKEENE